MASRRLTCGIALHRPKTAALFFDLIYAASEPGMPPNIIAFPLVGGNGPPSRFTFDSGTGPGGGLLQTEMSTEKVQHDISVRLPELLEYLVSMGLHPVPVYDSNIDLREDFQEGSEAVLAAAIANIGIVDEARLQWEQVAELRNDEDARKDLRRLLHWFNADLAQKEQSFVEDEISNRLDNYESALKKCMASPRLSVP